MSIEHVRARRIAEIIERLRARIEPPPLEPRSVADSQIKELLDSTLVELLFEGEQVASRDDALAVQGGLYLWNDCLDESHRISQKIDTETGSYWHAIVHRREPDYSNSKHWWRKAGQHAVFQEVREAAMNILSGAGGGWAVDKKRLLEEAGQWLPFEFVDWCEACAAGALAEARPFLEAIQLEEIKILMGHSYRMAIR